MKIYLILLAISFIGYLIVKVHTKMYGKENYKKLKPYPKSEVFLNKIRSFVLILFIFPSIITICTFVFAYDTYIAITDEQFSKDTEHWEKKR